MEGQSGTVVTICIPSFNRAELISETLDSISAQTFPLWEALVVDDGSVDDSIAVVEAASARDSRIRLLRRERDPKGACTCRNIGVEAARGRYVMFLDTDDVLAPFCLEQRVRVLEAQPALDFAIFPMLLFKGSAANADRLWNVDTDEDDLVRVLRMDPVCQGTGTLWRRASFARMGVWNETLAVWQDIELHLRAFALGFSYVKRFDLPPDVYLRETEGSLSRDGFNSSVKLASRAKVARTAVGLLLAHRPEIIQEARFLCSSVVLGAAASRNFVLANEMLEWATRRGVFTGSENRRLRLALLMTYSRVDRLMPAASLRRNLVKPFSTQSTLGRVPHADPAAHADVLSPERV